MFGESSWQSGVDCENEMAPLFSSHHLVETWDDFIDQFTDYRTVTVNWTVLACRLSSEQRTNRKQNAALSFYEFTGRDRTAFSIEPLFIHGFICQENEIGSFQFISWLWLLHTAASVLLCLIVYSWDKSQSRIEESWINYSENMQIRWGSDLKEPSSLKKKVWGNSPVYVSAHVCSVHTVCNSHLSILTGVDIMSLFKVALKSNFIFKALTPM